MNSDTIDGYVGDSLYPSSFHMPFSATWVDAVFRHRAITPPRADKTSFTMVDLGCGDGLGLIIQAAAYPHSQFIGIDAMPAHIERGNAFIAQLGLRNIELRCQTFAGALAGEAIGAHYVAVQGVWSWVSRENRQALLKLISHSLHPGGVAIAGYNCLPGWTPIAAMQKLVHALAACQPGTPAERFANAFARARTASEAGMAALGDEQIDWLTASQDQFAPDYFAHEYLNDHWQPLWSGDAIRSAAEHGLHFQGTSLPTRLREDFILKRAQRDQLDKTESLAAREIMADMFLNCWFRTDIFSKADLTAIADDDAQAARLDGCWMACAPKDQAEFSTQTTAGKLKFDNPSAHHILDQLETGPAALAQIFEADHPGTVADLFNSIDALLLARLVRPVDALLPDADPAAVNDWLCRSEERGLSFNAVLTPHGPVSVGREELRATLSSPSFRQRAGL